MEKPLEVCDRINTLRLKLGKSQAELAELVGVKQPTVSDWETPGKDVPSSDSYARLGNLAPYPDCLWFWTQAGMNQDAMLSAAAKLLKERGEVPKTKMIAVPPLRRTARETEEVDSLWYLDARLVPNAASVAYWVVDASDPLPSPWHEPGTVIILDTSANDATDLAAC